MNDNIQIVHNYFYPSLLVKWKKERIEVGLHKSILFKGLEIAFVKGPSFKFIYQKNRIENLEQTTRGIKRVWKKTVSDKWVKVYTTLTINNPKIQSNGSMLSYSKKYVLYDIYVTYDLLTQNGMATVFPVENSMTKWIATMNPSIKNMELKNFKI